MYSFAKKVKIFKCCWICIIFLSFNFILDRIYSQTHRLFLPMPVESAHVCFKVLRAAHVCRFRNVCLANGRFHDKRKIEYFLPKSSSGERAHLHQNVSDLVEEKVLLPLRAFATTQRAQGLIESHNFLAVEVTTVRNARKLKWIETTSVLFSPFWPENWGHAVFDDLYSIWCSLQIFGIRGNVARIFHSGFPFSGIEQQIRSNEIYREFSKRIGMKTPLNLHDVKRSSNSHITCFRDLLVGTGALSMREYPHQLQEFSRVIRGTDRLRGDIAHINVVFLDKTDGKHKRPIYNIQDAIDTTSQVFPTARVSKLNSSKLATLSLRSRLRTLSRIDILVTVPGAASLNAAFMRPGTVLIVLDVFEPSSSSSIALESYIWNAMTDVATLFFEVTKQDMVISSESDERPKSDPRYTDFLYRDFAGYYLPMNRLQQALQTAVNCVNIISA